MTDASSAFCSKHIPWNKGKIIGAKPPLRPKHVWSIRTKLQVEGRVRDLALFNLAIDSKLRGCDLVALKVDDVAPNGYAADRATVRQKKTGRPVKFELTEATREAVDHYQRTATYQITNGQIWRVTRQKFDARWGRRLIYLNGPQNQKGPAPTLARGEARSSRPQASVSGRQRLGASRDRLPAP